MQGTVRSAGVVCPRRGPSCRGAVSMCKKAECSTLIIFFVVYHNSVEKSNNSLQEEMFFLRKKRNGGNSGAPDGSGHAVYIKDAVSVVIRQEGTSAMGAAAVLCSS